MIAESKNGKVHTIYIYSTKIIPVLFLFFIIPFAPSWAVQGKKWVIVIDPGHGGRDPGALGSFVREKDINLAIALKTGEYLEKNLENVKIVYTRKTDVTVDLYDRPKIANENKADLFLSIHANQTSVKSVMGTETFVMGLTKDKANLEVVMKENEVMLLEEDYSTKYQGFDPKSTESNIMFSMMQNAYQKQSTNLASKIQTQFTEKVNRRNRGVKQGALWVLFNTTMPSVLIETGFLSNPGEEKFLSTAQGQDYLASAIFRACRDYITEISNRIVSLPELKRDTAITARLIPVSGPSTGSIAFMVQVSASNVKTEVRPENFKGLNDITELTSQGRFKYATGRFTEYQDAVNHRKDLKNIYPDAFVIAVMDTEIIPLQQALNQKKKK